MKRINKSNRGKVLFLCTGNSCRSQLAEAIVNHQLTNDWVAYSAGSKPTGNVHPLTLAVLKEIGIHHQGRSKDVLEFINQDFDIVMTVCDSAQEDCPIWLKPGRQLHFSFPDPAKVTGDQEEILAAFRKVRDDIAKEISDILKNTIINQDNPG